MRTIVLITAILVSSIAPASAADHKDVARIVGMIANKNVPVISRKGNQIVFVHKGMRYTFWNSGERIKEDDHNSAWLSVWVRKDGTSGQENLDAFSDHGFDGIVDFGINGPKTKIFESGVGDLKAHGLEYQTFWQENYDKAIEAGVEYLRSHSK